MVASLSLPLVWQHYTKGKKNPTMEHPQGMVMSLGVVFFHAQEKAWEYVIGSVLR